MKKDNKLKFSTVMITLPNRFVKCLFNIYPLKQIPNSIAIALSGGVDSMTLLSLLISFRSKYQPSLNIHAITIDHKLRKESTNEANSIMKLLSELPVKHIILPIETDINTNQMEKHARELRYKLMKDYCEKNKIKNIFMGHHFDDQLETFMIRLNSNSTIFGLAGMEYKSSYFIQSPIENLKIIRPLLDITKDEIYDYARREKLKWFEDYTNSDESITKRNYYRKLLKDNKQLRVEIGNVWLKVRQVVDDINGSVRLLDEELIHNFDIKKETGCLKIKIPLEISNKYNWIVLDRWLFNKIWFVSPIDQYRYRFTNINSKCSVFINQSGRSLSEDIWNIQLNRNSHYQQHHHHSMKFTLLNCLFSVSKTDENILIQVYRAREYARHKQVRMHLHLKNENDWVYFDNRYFLRFKLDMPSNLQSTSNYALEAYDDDKHFTALKLSFKEYRDIRSKASCHIPVLLEKNHTQTRLVGFPTLAVYRMRGVSCQVAMKSP